MCFILVYVDSVGLLASSLEQEWRSLQPGSQTVGLGEATEAQKALEPGGSRILPGTSVTRLKSIIHGMREEWRLGASAPVPVPWITHGRSRRTPGNSFCDYRRRRRFLSDFSQIL